MATSRLNLTRDQLATFLKDHELIKQFERLFATVDVIAPDLVNEIAISAGSAQATANDALALIESLENSLTADGSVIDAKSTLALQELQALKSELQLKSLEPAEQNNNAIITDYLTINEHGHGENAVGRMIWDEGEGTIDFGLKGGNVVCKIGVQEYVRAYNDTLLTMTKGQIVYISGAQGNRVAVKLAQADSEANSAHTIGIVAETISNGGEGFVQVSGSIYKLNTLGTIAGDTVYLSPTIAGAWTTTKPTAPDHLVILGFIERVHASVGSIFIKVDNGYELDELHNVKITSVANNDLLQYDNAGPYWKNVAPSAISIGTATNLAGGVAGSLPYQTAASTTTFLGIGAANYVLTSTGTAPTWTANTGTGSVVRATSPTLVTPVLGVASGTSLSLSNNLTFLSTGQRITGDFSTATIADRPLFQTTVANSATTIGVIPSGTAFNATISLESAESATNCSAAQLAVVGGTDVRVTSLARGTGTVLPIAFWIGGSERMRIAASGHVGISTTPSAWVASVRAIQIGVGGSVSTWDGSNGSVTLGANLYDAGSATIKYINSAAAGAFDIVAGAFAWRTAPAGIAGAPITFTQPMTLTSAGSLGIGTASPAVKLDVIGDIRSTSGANHIVLAHDGTNGRLTNTGGSLLLYANGAQSMIMHTNGVERARITSTGNVGIGTSAPSYKLQTQGAVAAVSTATLTGTNNDIKLLLNNDATNNSVAGHLGMIAWVGHNRSVASNLSAYISAYKDTGQFDDTANLVFATSDTATMPVERMRITRSGSVGIGTTTPADRLEIAAGGTLRLTTTNWNAGAIRFFSNLAGALNYDYMIQRGGDATFKDYLVAHIPGNADPGRFGVISSGGNVRFVVEGDTGNVGIGTATNLSTLTVNGSFASKSPSTVNAATYTVAATDGSLRFTTTNCTVTLPAPASFPGRILYLNTITANSVISASANVIPLGSNTAGTAILAATAAKFAMLQSDGTNWITMMAN